MSIFDLTGKIAVVTGGNRGIGLGMARGLAKAGASVSIWSRDAVRSEEARAELEKLGAPVEARACDVAKEEDIARCASETIESMGRIDICIANAGYGSPVDPLEMSLSDWRELMAVNLDGVFLTLREAARNMKDGGHVGKLIAVSSISAHFGTPKQPHYAASKAALGALVRSLAVELARYDIQVNSIQPGWIETEATARAKDHEPLNNVLMRRTPARRWGSPEDLEGIAVYLASNASNYHTGDSICIDGGYSVF
jgi:NAD(P)-dependent dehydrogenase (short-subunit alcohol dehydrogenase family)